jgi:hypothetical protein
LHWVAKKSIPRTRQVKGFEDTSRTTKGLLEGAEDIWPRLPCSVSSSKQQVNIQQVHQLQEQNTVLQRQLTEALTQVSGHAASKY